jgi:hypothetical protein
MHYSFRSVLSNIGRYIAPMFHGFLLIRTLHLSIDFECLLDYFQGIISIL